MSGRRQDEGGWDEDSDLQGIEHLGVSEAGAVAEEPASESVRPSGFALGRPGCSAAAGTAGGPGARGAVVAVGPGDADGVAAVSDPGQLGAVGTDGGGVRAAGRGLGAHAVRVEEAVRPAGAGGSGAAAAGGSAGQSDGGDREAGGVAAEGGASGVGLRAAAPDAVAQRRLCGERQCDRAGAEGGGLRGGGGADGAARAGGAALRAGAGPTELWQSDLFTFVLKRENSAASTWSSSWTT